tara:strand:+ start:429 stop:590 length:162 start_codon:yes stop_codon:yes gene_type:complete
MEVLHKLAFSRDYMVELRSFSDIMDDFGGLWVKIPERDFFTFVIRNLIVFCKN